MGSKTSCLWNIKGFHFSQYCVGYVPLINFLFPIRVCVYEKINLDFSWHENVDYRARRFPIKLYHTTRTIYRQYKGCLFYAESGYEKEAWCEVLRATARAKGYDKDWYSSVKKEFLEYTSAAEKHVPYLTRFHSTTKINHRVAKPTDEQSDDHKQSDEGVSKKRLILNKLLRRNGSKGKDVKDSKDEGNSRKGKGKSLVSDDHEDIKSTSNGSHLSNESHTRSESTSSDSDGDKSILAISQKDNEESDEVLPSPLVHGHDNVRDEKEIDQGQLCLNMIVGRLFFDFYHSKTRVKWLQNQFQASFLLKKIYSVNGVFYFFLLFNFKSIF